MIEHERRYDGDDHGTRIALLEQSTKAIKDHLDITQEQAHILLNK